VARFLGPVSAAGTYEFLVADLLHDPQFQRWTQTQVDSYINEARRQLVRDTGALRVLSQSYITQGQEAYSFGQVTGISITNGGSGYSTPPAVNFTGGGGVGAAATATISGGAVNSITFSSFGASYTSPPAVSFSGGGGSGAAATAGVLSVYVYDLLGVHIYWGTQRYALLWRPFREFSAIWRAFQQQAYQRQPGAWCVYGYNSIFIGPPPDQTYQVEFDTLQLPVDFVVGDTTTPEVVPSVLQDPIAYYAAYLAKKNSRNFGEAESLLNDYRRVVMECNAAYTGRLPSPYPSDARW
jgi:hypothetical protein